MRSINVLIVAMGLLTFARCSHGGLDNAPPDAAWEPLPPITWTEAERDVDLLFVIDNSGSMAGEAVGMRLSVPALTAALGATTGGLPNLHVGVTTTDLGTGEFQITYCEDVGGDAGALVTGNCTNPTGGAPYLIDVEPRSCEITRDDQNQCSAHTCSQSNCAHEPTTTFVEDAGTGCPRCRNFAGESLEDAFTCIADLGTMGCGFEQPLEAMYKALDPANTANHGFVRDNAYLAILMLTDEDDCSASDPRLYDNTQTELDSTLGPLTSYRCFEFGVTCDINDRTHQGLRQNCVPREDAAALLHPISRYRQFLQSLKDPQKLFLAAIAGPVTPSSSGVGHNMEVGLDDDDQPELQYGCTTAVDGAIPGIRIHNLVAAFNEEEDLAAWAYTSNCSADYTPVLQGLGDRIRTRIENRCLPSPLAGCADVGVEFGTPRAAQTCAVNAQCLASCRVTDIFDRGLATETLSDVPPCLDLLPDGTILSSNTDRTLAYAGAHPQERDPNLPAPACWHIRYQERCPESNYSELIIARRADPPPRAITELACRQIAPKEDLCNDQQDNDENCLVDAEDPCCQTPGSCR